MEDIESGTGRYLGEKTPVAVKSLTFSFTPEQVLYGRLRPYLNKVLLPDFEGHCSTEIFPLRPKPALDRRFLHYWIMQETIVSAIDATCTGARMPRADVNDILKFVLPLPPLGEQRRIVAVLDKTFAGIATATANAQKNLTNARAVFEEGLENTFSDSPKGWESKRFSELCTIKHGFAFKSEFFSLDGDYVLLTPGNFYETGGYRDRGAKQKFYTGEVPPDFILGEGDLLVAMTEQADGLLGSPIIVPDGATFLHNQRLGLVKPKPGVAWCSEYFFHVFNTKAVRLALRRTGTGAKVRHTSPTKIGEVEISFPKDEAEQRQVAAKLTALEFRANELANIQVQKLAALAELKQSLLRKAFAGELTADIGQSLTQITNDSLKTPQFTANVIAFAYRQHETQQMGKTFGRVKAQKSLHAVESLAGLDLGRQPIKDAAGPNDFPHMLRAEDWARAQGFFEFVPRATGPGYDFKKLSNYTALLPEAVAATKPYTDALKKAIDPLVPLLSQDAGIFMTVHAAWNNLICDGADITDDAIVHAARDDWHKDKLKIPVSKFREAIRQIRAKGLIPDGTAKYVGGQVKLL